MSASWYVLIGEKPVGPASSAELLRAHFMGRYGPDALVRSDGAEDWKHLSDVFPLAELTPPPLPAQNIAIGARAKASSWVRSPAYAWRRYFARQLDTLIHATIMFVFLSAALAANDVAYRAAAGVNNALVLNVIGVILAVLPSALLIGATGRTFGKLIFGLKVSNARGRAPGFLRAFKREAQVLVQGLALGIPLIALVTFIGGYNKLHNQGHTDWDAGNDLTTWYRRPTILHWLLMVTGIALWLSIVAVVYAAGRDAG